MRNRTRVAAAGLLVAAAAGAVVSASGATTTVGTVGTVGRPSASAVAAPDAIEVTFAGLDGTHGPVTTTVRDLGTRSVQAAETAAAQAQTAAQPRAAAAVAKPPAATSTTPTTTGLPAQSEGLHPVLATGAAAAPKTGRAATVRPHATSSLTELSSGIDLLGNGTATFTNAGTRYVSANFKVRNAQACSTGGSCTAYTTANKNITLLAAETTGTLAQTAISKIKLFDGSTPSNAASLATSILPADGVTTNANTASGTALPTPGLESLQLFTESEISGLTLPTGVTSALPYGYVVKNLNNPTTRSLPASPATGDYEGGVTIGVSFPTQTPATNNPFSITVVYLVVTDLNTRVTQSLEEDNPAGDLTSRARETALGSTDLAVLGDNHVTRTNDGNPICSVRTAGTAANPTAYLVNDPGKDNVASVPALLNPTSPIKVGFCQSMTQTSSIWNQFVVSGTQSGARTAATTLTGSYSGAGTNALTFTPSGGFYTGERVEITLTSGLTSSSGAHPSPYVALARVGGAQKSSGEFSEDVDPNAPQAALSEPGVVASADFNRDGYNDLVEAGAGESDDVGDSGSAFVALYDNNRDGTVHFVQTVKLAATPTAIAAGDLNGDGVPDVVVAENTGSAGQLQVLLGTSTGMLGSAGAPITKVENPIIDYPDQIILGDFSHDGILDAVLAQENGNADDEVIIGDGHGNFTSEGILPFSSVGVDQGIAIASADFDGDGYPDIVGVGSTNKIMAVALSRSGAAFTILGTDVVSTGTETPISVTVGDVNGDGILDVIAGDKSGNASIFLGETGMSSNYAAPVTTNLGDGAATQIAFSKGTDHNAVGLFSNISAGTSQLVHTEIVSISSQGVYSITLQDLFQVSSGQLLVTGLRGAGASNDVVYAGTFLLRVYLANDPANTFREDGSTEDLVAEQPSLQHVQPAIQQRGLDAPQDVSQLSLANLSGTLDVVSSNVFANTITYSIAGQTAAPQPGSAPVAGTTQTLTLPAGTGVRGFSVADFDGDGNLDLAVIGASRSGDNVYLYGGDGTGNFTEEEGSFSLPAAPGGIVAGDFNGDGHPDLAISLPSLNEVLIELYKPANYFDFAGTATAASFPSASSLDIGDFNGDGALDLAIADPADGRVEIATGTGTGTFTAGASYPVGADPVAISVGDINNDQLDDIVTANRTGNSVSLLTGSPGGTFTATTTPLGGGATSPDAIAVGDLNGDGYEDVVTADFDSNQVSVLDGSAAGLSESTRSPVSTVGYPSGIAIDGQSGVATIEVAGYQSGDIATLHQAGGKGSGLLEPDVVTSRASGTPHPSTAAERGR